MAAPLRDASGDEPRPRPAPNIKPDLVPTTAHTMALVGGIILCLCVTITLFGGPWQWLVVGVMLGGVIGTGAFFRWKLDKNNAAALRARATPPTNGWRGRGDGPGR